MVKSEIVVPIFVKNKLAAELDIESYLVSTFTKSEQDFVEACATIVGEYLGKPQPGWRLALIAVNRRRPALSWRAIS